MSLKSTRLKISKSGRRESHACCRIKRRLKLLLDSDLARMGLFFQASVALYHEFAQGRTKPYDAYLVTGPNPGGYCLGVRQVTVLLPFKAAVFDELLPEKLYSSPYAFACLSLFSCDNPTVQLAEAETARICPHQLFSLKDLTVGSEPSYQKDLDRLLSVSLRPHDVTP